MISKDNWRKYIDKLAAIDDQAADLMQKWIDENGLEDGEAAIQYAYALATKYGEASATLACEMYDYMAEIMDADVPEAMPAETATLKEVAKSTTWGKYHSPSQIPSAVGRHVRQAGADTMIQNAKRDKAQWAWVPQGDTCAFCITLASRGWQEASRTILKGYHAEHIHQNCDCTFAIAFKEKDKRQYDRIYDPDKYKKKYDDADGDLNTLRREIYQNVRNGPLLIEAENPFKHPKTPLKIAKYNQSKHIVGGDKYIEYMKTHEYEPSIVTLTDEEIQALVDKYHGTGILSLDKNGNVISSEMIVDNDMIIGYAVNNTNGKTASTSGFKIHYSGEGTHIVPMYENQKEYWKKRREQNDNDWLLRQKG